MRLGKLQQGLKLMKILSSLFTTLAILFAGNNIASAFVVFSETFDDASSASKFSTTTVAFDSPSSPDVYFEYGFDYSATGSSRLTQSIGLSPNGGSSTGLALAANLGGGNRSSINLYPILSGIGLSVDATSGLPVLGVDYKMTFDFWSGVNNAGIGTTEILVYGAQSNGDGQHMAGFPGTTPDSDFMEVNTAGDLNGDYRPTAIRNGSIVLEESIPSTAPAPLAAFPPETYLAQLEGGAPGEAWAEAEVRHEAGITSFLFNGVVISTIDFSDFGNDLGTKGLPWFGYTDLFNSQAGGDSFNVGQSNMSFDPFNASFVIIDNVVVELLSVPEPSSLLLLMLGATALVRKVR